MQRMTITPASCDTTLANCKRWSHHRFCVQLVRTLPRETSMPRVPVAGQSSGGGTDAVYYLNYDSGVAVVLVVAPVAVEHVLLRQKLQL
jgi:hypothetical protein